MLGFGRALQGAARSAESVAHLLLRTDHMRFFLRPT